MTITTTNTSLRRVGVAAMLAVVVLLALPAAAFAFDREDPGRPVVDDAGVLTQDEIHRIEEAVERVDAAGVPVVVYLRIQDSSTSETIADGRALMEQWDVQSQPGARDGVVVFLNLDEDDPSHGYLALVVGEEHHDGGALPQSELDRIRGQMTDLLADGQMAEGIELGLDLIAERLVAGPPEPSAFEEWATGFAAGPISWLNGLALVAAGALSLILVQAWGARPRVAERWQDQSTTPPSDLHPSYAGAVTRGVVDDAQIEAALLDLAQRGALAIEPVPNTKDKIRIRLLEDPVFRVQFEADLWTVLEESAVDGVIEPDDVRNVYTRLEPVRQSLKADLVGRGWFDPNASRKRFPLIAVGAIASVLAIGALVPAVASDERWGLLAVVGLAIIGVLAFILASMFPNTTAEGERVAQKWRGYQAGLRSSRSAPYGAVDLDTAFPHLVAMGLAGEFKPYFEKASNAGYVPGWLRAHDDPQPVHVYWIPYWVALHGTMAPTSTGGVTTTGGASVGSGASGGRF